jgi:negative regulator of flagellin synthesis FlgM
MKIGQLSDTRVAGSSSGVSKSGQSSSASSVKSSSVKGSAVTVSNLAQAMEQTGKGPDIDTAKVESVRTAIANGSYKVNADAIADKLLSNAKEMFTRKSH